MKNRLFKVNPEDEYDAMDAELRKIKLIFESAEKHRLKYYSMLENIKKRFAELTSRKDQFSLLRKFQNN